MKTRTSVAALIAALAFTRGAHATNVMEVPDVGSEQLGRGGAWVARASEPLAAFFNPAGLAGQDTRLSLEGSVAVRHACFTRTKASSDATDDGVSPGASYARVCDVASPFPNGQIAFAYRITPRVGLGFSVLGPSGVPRASWPEFVGQSAAPQRYLLLEDSAEILTPTVGIGVEIVDGVRVGGSLQWGVAHLRTTGAASGLGQPGMSPAVNDEKATIDVKDFFFPGFTLGAIWSATAELDVAAWYKWSAPIVATGDVRTDANYFTPRVAAGDTSKVARGDSSRADCGDAGSTACANGPVATVRVPIPMEAKLGLRWHLPRSGVRAPPRHRRDPLAHDRFDVEIDFTWANDRALDDVQIRFPSAADGRGTVPVVGTAGVIPPVADVMHRYKDVVGARVGGDWNLLADLLAVRAGAFVETRAADATYQNIDVAGSARVGIAAGATLRLRPPGGGARTALELTAAYARIEVADSTNDDPRAPGLHTMTGTPPYRTSWPTNLGTVTNAFDVVNVGVAYRF